MNEKKKIVLLILLMLVLIVAIWAVLTGGREKDIAKKELSEIPGTKIEMQQEEKEVEKEESVQEPTNDSGKESVSEVIELPFIPAD